MSYKNKKRIENLKNILSAYSNERLENYDEVEARILKQIKNLKK